MEIYRQYDKDSAAAEAGENLNRLLQENLKKPVLLMLSGGSSLSVLDYVGKTALGANLTVSMLDERFSRDEQLYPVRDGLDNSPTGTDRQNQKDQSDINNPTASNGVNNFSQLQKTDFYTDALEADVSFFGTLPRHEDTMETLAKRWETNLKNWKNKNPDGLIIATLGMGLDGHTAGIFPFPENPDEFKRLFQSDSWVSFYNAGNKNKFAERITTTLTFFKLIDIGLAYVCGNDKKDKLDGVIAKKSQPVQLPALGWQNIKDVRIFTDIDTE